MLNFLRNFISVRLVTCDLYLKYQFRSENSLRNFAAKSLRNIKLIFAVRNGLRNDFGISVSQRISHCEKETAKFRHEPCVCGTYMSIPDCVAACDQQVVYVILFFFESLTGPPCGRDQNHQACGRCAGTHQ